MMRALLVLLPAGFVLSSGAGVVCPHKLNAIFADMHDGDKKEVSILGNSLTIKPANGNEESWIVNANLDTKTCSANVDFNVPGKQNAPPVSLTARFWYSGEHTGKSQRAELEFKDPSGHLADKDSPLNRWVSIAKHFPELPKGIGTKLNIFKMIPCVHCLSLPHAKKSIFLDLHDGDKKEVSVSCESITIKPHGNNQKWEVHSTFDNKTCSAVIDFKVPGKPNPAPVKLLATLLRTGSLLDSDDRFEYEFTDPTGTLAAEDFPLNHWVELPSSASKTVNSHKMV